MISDISIGIIVKSASTVVMKTLITIADVEFPGSQRMWLLMTLFVALPGVSFCYYYAKKREKEELSHPRPEFVPYSHLRIRTKVTL